MIRIFLHKTKNFFNNDFVFKEINKTKLDLEITDIK